MKIKNDARCRKCGDEIESKSRHDFVTCKCGAISVDGGQDYMRRCGNPEDFLPVTQKALRRKRISSRKYNLLCDKTHKKKGEEMKDGMSDAEMYRILNDFAKDHALAAGLEVDVSPYGMSFKTIDTTIGGKYEYSHLLSEYIHGAEQLLMWARRANRVRFKHLKKAKKTSK